MDKYKKKITLLPTHVSTATKRKRMAYIHGLKKNDVITFPARALMMQNGRAYWCSVSEWRMRNSYRCVSNSYGWRSVCERLFVHHSIESVHRIRGVFDGTSGTVRFDEGVSALYYVTVAGFLLVFDVAGDGVLRNWKNVEIKVATAFF